MSEDQLPDLPALQYLSASKLTTTSTPGTSPSFILPHTTAFTSPTTTTGSMISPHSVGGRSCHSPNNSFRGKSSSPLRKSLEFIRVSRHEWDYKDQLVASLRNEVMELKTKLRSQTSDKESHQRLLSSCQSLLLTLNGGEGAEVTSLDALITKLTNKVVKLNEEHSQHMKEMPVVQDELAKLKGEVAACNVKLQSYQGQIEQAKVTITSRDSEILQLKREVESSQQNSARTSSMLQSLKRQLTESEEGQNKVKITHSQNETLLSQIKSQLKQKETQLEIMQDQLRQFETEKEELEERASVADSAYEEVCFQLSESLQVEDSCDVDSMMLKVGNLVKENEELKDKVGTLNHSNTLAELDSKASRETIMKLVSDVKKHKEEVAKLTPLQKNVNELVEKLQESEKEKKSLLERLQATRETISSLQQDITKKETNCAEIKRKLDTIEDSRKHDKQFQQQYSDLLESLCSQFGGQTDKSETAIKQKIQEIREAIPSMTNKISKQSRNITELKEQLDRKDSQINELNETIRLEKEKTQEATGQLCNMEILERQVHHQDDKYKSFIKRCAAALKVESTTSSIMAGEFAEDAVLLKAEQLSQHETQALAERKSTIYSLQRKLKTSKQQLESKELHINLLQRKVTALEERVTTAVEKETEWESTLNRGKKMTNQLDKLQSKVSQQKQIILQLKEDQNALHQLKEHYDLQDQRLKELETEVIELQETRVHLSQQLAEARIKVHTAVSADAKKADTLEEEMKIIQDELKQAQEREAKLSLFHTSVHQLINKEECNDEKLIQELTQLSLSCQKYKDLSQNLQASLRTLESGFRTSYEDTLTLLKSEI